MIQEERRKQIVEDLLSITGPVLKISDFDKFPVLPAAQTIRNRISKQELSRDLLLKMGWHTLVDMKK